MSFSGVGLRSFLENCTEKRARSTLRAGAWRREARKGRTLEAKPAKGKRENKGGSVAQKGNWKGLLFANLVDTDQLYGHRNDVKGFARALEDFDKRLPEILKLLGEDGMLIITADHGCDPAYPTTDHTRERVPLLVWGLGLEEGVELGRRNTFADVSATVLEALGCREKLDGTSFLKDVLLKDE